MSTRSKAEALAGAAVPAAFAIAVAVWRWPAHFLPDLVAAALLLAGAAVALRRRGVLLRSSLLGWLRHGNAAQRFVLLILIAALLASFAVLGAALYPYYRARLFWAKADRHWADAASLMQRGLYGEAARELERQGDEFCFVSPAIAERARAAAVDNRLRIDSARDRVRRFRAAIEGTRTPSFEELMLAQQAAVLYPQSAEVRQARAEARRRLSQAIDSYVAAIDALREGRQEESRRLVMESKRVVSGFLHQEALLSGSAPPALIEFYRRDPKLRAAIERIPMIASLLK